MTQLTSFTGTIMKNRIDLPDDIRSPDFHLEGGEVKAYRDGALLALAWRADKKKNPVVMLSSAASAKKTQVRT